MEIDKRDRTQLKAYFAKNTIPTEGNFADLIDATLNQKDDGIVKSAGNPLAIEAVGDAASRQQAIDFYASFTDAAPAWVLSLTAIDAGATRVGFDLSDGGGTSRLFIDRASGNVGIGTTSPGAGLEVAGTSVLAQQAWQNAGFQNGWTNYGGSYNHGGYFKDSMGIVHLRGLVKNGSVGNSYTIFTLPAGYRPAGRELLCVMTNSNASGRVDIETNGRVIPYSVNNGWVSLDSLTFRAA